MGNCLAILTKSHGEIWRSEKRMRAYQIHTTTQNGLGLGDSSTERICLEGFHIPPPYPRWNRWQDLAGWLQFSPRFLSDNVVSIASLLGLGGPRPDFDLELREISRPIERTIQLVARG